MDDLFYQLETRLKSFVEKYQAMREDNEHLTNNQLNLMREKETLMLRHKTVVSQIETMVEKLKSTEKIP